MDWIAFGLSLRLSLATTLILLFVGIAVAHGLAQRRFVGRSVVEAVVALPLVLPPTVLGYYLLVALGGGSPMGRLFRAATGDTLAFSFSGLLLASVIYSLPFAVQPMLRGFEAIPRNLREAAWCSGLSRWRTFLRIELPLAWPGILTAMVLSFAHTMGEFGVVLMVGGNIPGETKTISIAIYDKVEALESDAAGVMSLVLLMFALVTISLVFMINRRVDRRYV
jgi:molybdate transport system permease protein